MFEKKETILEFVHYLCAADTRSRSDIMQKMGNVGESVFYTYLSAARKNFTIKCVGSIGGNAYYSIDKKTVKKYFNL